jgi:hypothetical protein
VFIYVVHKIPDGVLDAPARIAAILNAVYSNLSTGPACSIQDCLVPWFHFV